MQVNARPKLTRTRMIMLLMAVIGAIFICRLFYLQVIRHDFYEQEAIKEHITKFTIASKRGLIYARDGTDKFAPLVLNEPVFTVYADPRYVKDAGKVSDVMRRVAGGTVVRGMDENLRDKSLQYTVLARQVTKAQAELIKKEDLAGVGMQEQEKRVYPEGELAAHVLGFVNGEGKGQYGVEQGLDDQLSGKPGQLKAVTDVYGIPISIGAESVQTPPQNGKNLVLSIDRTVQHRVEEALKKGLENSKATIGSILVMNPNNGQILAMANTPTFNPNDFGKVEDYKTFQNRIVSDPYEPGSIIKALTMAVGLNEGVIEPSSTYNNTSSVKIDDAVIKNVLNSPTGSITMTQVLEYSFNTGVVHVLKQLSGGKEITTKGKQTLYDYYTKRFFFGESSGVNLAGDVQGEIISPEHQYGGDVRYANMTFGQGMNTSMLQVAAAFSACINGGSFYTPQIVSGYLDENNAFTAKSPELRKTGVISTTASDKLRTMLRDARSRGAVGRGDKAGYNIGGKTGTAQVYDEKTGKYSEDATIGSYVGFGGQDKPQYVIMVRIDDAKNGGYSGSAAAAPVFTEVSNWMLNYLQIQPKG